MKFTRQTTLLKKCAIVHNVKQNKKFANKADLVKFLNSFESDNVSECLHVKCVCNKDFIYATISDIPTSKVICDCGQKIIEYDS